MNLFRALSLLCVLWLLVVSGANAETYNWTFATQADPAYTADPTAYTQVYGLRINSNSVQVHEDLAITHSPDANGWTIVSGSFTDTAGATVEAQARFTNAIVTPNLHGAWSALQGGVLASAPGVPAAFSFFLNVDP